MLSLPVASRLAVLLGVLVSPGIAQCDTPPTFVPGLDGAVYASQLWDPDGSGPLPARVLFGGSFTQRIAAWEPATGAWTWFQGGTNGNVHQIVVLPNGEFVVGGLFGVAGGVAAAHVARWTGTAWAPLGAGLPGGVSSLLLEPSGDLVAAHLQSAALFQVARWNGTTWTPLGAPHSGHWQVPLAIAPNGELLAGSYAGVMRWNGSAWTNHAPGITDVIGLATTPSGQLFAAGNVASPWGRHFATWDGTSWTTLGTPFSFTYGYASVNDVDFLPDGDPVVCGQIFFASPGTTPVNLIRWDGFAWVGLHGPLSGLTSNGVTTATFLPSGELVAAGPFSSYVARFRPTCPATQVGAGAGCPSSGGANVLAVESLPWLGGAMRARGTGLPALSFVTEVYGFAPFSLPLAAVLPQAQPGCNLLVSPTM